jgi:NAD(P)-dependent dehydrogenase (short-subunit alcohol dehydrogenase family)
MAHPAPWLITGISSGFGQALAAAALERGDIVAGTARQARALAAFEASAPGRAIGLALDLTNQEAIPDLVRAAEARTGGISTLVCNAGYGLVSGVEEASQAEIRAQFEVNVFGTLALIQAMLPFMRARRAGRIMVISSVSGLVGWPSLGIYSASKFALEGACETLAQELAPLGIQLTLIEPGGFRTAFAGTSRVTSAREIPDYAATVGENRATLAAHAGHERGDPARAAAAILHIAGLPKPPLRLLLGEDAVGYASAKLAARALLRHRFRRLTQMHGRNQLHHGIKFA